MDPAFYQMPLVNQSGKSAAWLSISMIFIITPMADITIPATARPLFLSLLKPTMDAISPKGSSKTLAKKYPTTEDTNPSTVKISIQQKDRWGRTYCAGGGSMPLGGTAGWNC